MCSKKCKLIDEHLRRNRNHLSEYLARSKHLPDERLDPSDQGFPTPKPPFFGRNCKANFTRPPAPLRVPLTAPAIAARPSSYSPTSPESAPLRLSIPSQ